MNYYNEIKNKLIDNEVYLKVKDYSKEKHKVITYFETGKLLYEAGSVLGDRYNYIDLLLYNIKFKCYVVVELKITELKKEQIGQIQTYMNYIDKNIKTLEEDKTIGIIIVKKNDKYVMEYCSDNRIIAKEYELVQ